MTPAAPLRGRATASGPPLRAPPLRNPPAARHAVWARTLTLRSQQRCSWHHCSPRTRRGPKGTRPRQRQDLNHIETSNPDDPILVGKPFTLGIDVEHEPGFIALLPTASTLRSDRGAPVCAKTHPPSLGERRGLKSTNTAWR